MSTIRFTTFRHRALATAASVVLVLSSIIVLANPASAHPGPHAVAPEDFQQVTLAKGVGEMGEPMGIAVLPDRSVLHTSRDGTLRLTDAAGNTKVAGQLDVYSHDEDGLQGVAVDPGFADNRWVYLYFAPPLSTPGGDAPTDASDQSAFEEWKGYNRLARFKLSAGGTLDLGSEQEILRVPADRGICCHVGGDIEFDAAGDLYLTTGDDTNSFASDGYTPIDERPTRNPAMDAQRSSANSNDLRGKVLRIKVGGDGTYSIPGGNMFPPGTPGTKPEIYAMGFRNPFRMEIDKATGIVYLGEYAPDNGAADPNRGPAGQVEFDRITGPGFYGWPYCTGTNTLDETYNDYDFATGTSAQRFDCQNDGPVNNSPRNTGVTQLPVPKASWLKYHECAAPEFGCSSAEAPMGGPVYRYDADLESSIKFPAELDQHFFMGDFSRRWIKQVPVNDNGSPGTVQDFPWAGTQVMDLEFGPEGALYVLDYGTGFFNGDENSALYRIEYTANANKAPTAVVDADKTSGQAPLTVQFSSSGSSDPEGGSLSYAWDFGDGGASGEASPAHTYTAEGTFVAELTVTDPEGNSGTASAPITVGNTAPTVTVTTPASGTLFEFGDTIPYTVEVTDPEEPSIDCSKVKVTFVLGHDSHGHGGPTANGCSGTVASQGEAGHGPGENVFGIVDAQYTDAGGLTNHGQAFLQPKTRQAEHAKTSEGVGVYQHSNAVGSATVGSISDGDWFEFDPYLLQDVAGHGATTFTVRVSSAADGGTLEVRAGSPGGTLLGSVRVPGTGDWNTFTEVDGTLSDLPADPFKLYLVASGGTGDLFDVDQFTFVTGSGGSGEITGIGGKCVDVAGADPTDGTQIQLYTCNATNAQQWTLPGDGTIRALGKCMDVKHSGTANGTPVWLYTCNGTGAQQWQPQPDGTLKNPQSGRCLDAEGAASADGTPLTIWDCHTGPNQQWSLP